MPPAMQNEKGEVRRVGFELEFAGLSVEAAGKAVQELFGGRIEKEGSFRAKVAGTELGEFSIEVDALLLHDRRYRKLLEETDLGVDLSELGEPLEKMVGWLAELVVPFEVTTPPVPLDELSRVDELRALLAQRKARGTGARLRYAMGLHINPEVVSRGAGSILRHLQAFLALYDDLVESSDIDLTRRLTPFIDEFPNSYLLLVLDPDYAPSLEEMAADYVAHNPTRNRPLDLLPLFVELLGTQVLAGVPESEKLRPRPTFHYRLPNCRVDEAEWTVAEEWNRWVGVEELAGRPAELARRCAEARPSEGLWERIKERTLRVLLGGER